MITDKMVRCVRNREKDPSPPSRPPRGSTSHPSTLVPTSRSASSSPLYEPDDNPEREQKDEHEGDQEDEHEEEDAPENEQAASTTSHNDIQDPQQDAEWG